MSHQHKPSGTLVAIPTMISLIGYAPEDATILRNFFNSNENLDIRYREWKENHTSAQLTRNLSFVLGQFVSVISALKVWAEKNQKPDILEYTKLAQEKLWKYHREMEEVSNRRY